MKRASNLASVLAELQLILELLKAFANGTYRQVSKRSLILLVGAAVYFLIPTDAIPDFLVGLGLLDDAMVIAAAVRTVRKELTAFGRWHAAHVERTAPSTANDAAQ